MTVGMPRASRPAEVPADAAGPTGLLPGGRSAPSKPPTLRLDRRTSAREGLQRIIHAGIGHLLANVPAAADRDAEGVHQVRGAIRRLRAALVLFRPHLSSQRIAPWEAELKRLGRLFGDARDWDVFCLETLAEAALQDQAPARRRLLREAGETRRRRAHDRIAGELGASALPSVLLGLSVWAQDGEGALRSEARLAAVAPGLLDRLHAKTMRQGGGLARRRSWSCTSCARRSRSCAIASMPWPGCTAGRR